MQLPSVQLSSQDTTWSFHAQGTFHGLDEEDKWVLDLNFALNMYFLAHYLVGQKVMSVRLNDISCNL